MDLANIPDCVALVAHSGLKPPSGRIICVTHQDPRGAYAAIDGVERLRREVGEVGIFFVAVRHPTDKDFLVGYGLQPDIVLAPHGAGKDLTDTARLFGLDFDDSEYKVVALELASIEAAYYNPRADG